MKRAFWSFLVIIAIAWPLGQASYAQQLSKEAADEAVISAIRDEEFSHSDIMENISWLADVFGPRLTGSPAFRSAGDWVVKRCKDYGLANVHKENWPFGKGWSLAHFDAHMVAPDYQPLIGFPKSWTPGTPGPVTAEVIRVDIKSEDDFQKYHGKLKGKIVLTQPAREVHPLEGILVQRWTEPLLKEAESTPLIAPAGEGRRGRRPAAASLQDKTRQFFSDEGVVAELDRGSDSYLVPGDNQMSWRTQRTDGGTVFVGIGGPHDNKNAGTGVPSVTLAVEHYNRILRILEKKMPVKVQLDVEAKFHDEDPAQGNGFNVIAEIPGSSAPNEIVLLGAHLDSHAAATGATDNAAGVAVIMEALRVLKAIGAKPRRTIRVGFWGGEEEGLLGSQAYVDEHLVDPVTNQFKPEYQNLVAYYNLDNGTGRIRGVWLQDNLATAPIFRAWFEPLRDLGVSAIAPRLVSGSDYASFDEVGIPAFQFMQDRVEYNSRTHHSNMDVVDHVLREDLVQSAVVMATFAYNTAMRDSKLPRKLLRPFKPAVEQSPTNVTGTATAH
jgi:carboxypeptidase Q